MLNRLGPLPRFLLSMAGLLVLLAVTAGLWWQLPAWPRARCLAAHPPCRRLLLSADGQTLLAVHPFGLSMWNVPVLRERAFLPVDPARGEIDPDYLWLSPDGQKVSGNQELFGTGPWLWNPAVQQQPFTVSYPLDRNINNVQGQVFTSDSQSVLIPWCTCVFRWDAATGQARLLPDEDYRGSDLLLPPLPDGRIFAARLITDDALKVWQVGSEDRFVVVRAPDFDPVVCPDGKWIAAGVGGNLLKFWDLRTGEEVVSLAMANPGGRVRPLQFSPDGSRLLVGVADPPRTYHEIEVLDVSTLPPRNRGGWAGDPVGRALAGAPWWDNTLEFSPDSRWLLSSPPKRRTLFGAFPGWGLWDMATLQRICGDPRDYANPVLAPDSKTLVVPTSRTPVASWIDKWLKRDLSAERHRLFILDTATGQEIAAINDCFSPVYFPDGKTLAACREDGTIELWDIPPRCPRWIDYGLPVVFALLVVLVVRLVWRGFRKPAEVTPC